MQEKEQYDLYVALDANPVIVQSEQHPMRIEGHYYTDTMYNFGDYMIKHTAYNPPSSGTPLGQFAIYKKNRNIAFWNESYKQQDKYVYDMYIAARNKAEGKQYVNPFNNPGDLMSVGYKFEQAMNDCLPNVLPGAMMKYRDAITKQLRQFFENTVKQYQ